MIPIASSSKGSEDSLTTEHSIGSLQVRSQFKWFICFSISKLNIALISVIRSLGRVLLPVMPFR